MKLACATLLLYVYPIAFRFAIASEFHVGRIALSLLPLPVVLPSTWLPSYFRSEENEHVARHALYATSFMVGAASIRWSVVSDAFPEAWTVHLILYLAVGAASLWWFVLSHVLENTVAPRLLTHQGDIAVLPLTLVAIATFVYDVPDDAFQFSRCVIFYVPIVVAWATLHFVAFNGFAQSRTTTYTKKGFDQLGFAGLLIGSVHLALIEMRARPESFLFFPMVAAVLTQVTTRPTDAPRLRAWWFVGACLVQTTASIGLGAALAQFYDATAAYLTPVLVGAGSVFTIPLLCGDWWVVPATLHASLLTLTFLSEHVGDLHLLDIPGVAAGFFVVFRVTHLLAPPEEIQIKPPGTPLMHATPPQQRARCSVACALRPLNRIPICHRWQHGEDVVRRMMSWRKPSCPVVFAGIWWMKGNSFPMQLVTVHGHEWRVVDGVHETTFALHKHTTRSATVAGLLNRLGQGMCTTRVEWKEGERWVRTPGWWWFRLLPCTYWLHRDASDVMTRVVFGATGNVVWQYKMLRIVRGDGSRTMYYGDFMRSYEGVPCIL